MDQIGGGGSRYQTWAKVNKKLGPMLYDSADGADRPGDGGDG